MENSEYEAVHPSAIGVNFACPAKANNDSRLRRLERESLNFTDGFPIAILIGKEVHRLVTGAGYKMPNRIKFDKHTRNYHEFEIQTQAMADVAKNKFKSVGLNIIRSEITLNKNIYEVDMTGTVDFACSREGHDGIFIGDLKTGLHPPYSAASQMAVYTAMWQLSIEDGELSAGHALGNEVFVMWLKRGTSGIHLLKWYPTDFLEYMGYEYGGTIGIMREHADYHIKVPGMHCNQCKMENCEMRFEINDATT